MEFLLKYLPFIIIAALVSGSELIFTLATPSTETLMNSLVGTASLVFTSRKSQARILTRLLPQGRGLFFRTRVRKTAPL